MTTDAKVGLLLGLVFIVIIAFVINGLPDFVRTLKDKPVVETAVTTQTGGNLVIEPAVVDVARSLQQGRTNLRYTEAPSQTIALDTAAGSSQTIEVQPEASSDTAPQSSFSNTVTAVNPQDNPALVLPQVQQDRQWSRDGQAIPADSQLTQTQQAARDTVSVVEPVVMPQPAKTQAIQPQTIAGKSHVVGEGESLGAIAKKYYGPEVGNQRATIQMLYDANKSVLESPNKVKIGDKLIIPKIAATSAKPVELAKPKSETLMDKFKGVFVSADKKDETAVKNAAVEEKPRATVAEKKVVVKKEQQPAAIAIEEKPKVSSAAKKGPDKTVVLPVKTKTALMPATIDYTIQSGDNPYTIAKKFLGDGDRYPEIIAMNKDKLTNPSKLVVGTQIRVPKR